MTGRDYQRWWLKLLRGRFLDSETGRSRWPGLLTNDLSNTLYGATLGSLQTDDADLLADYVSWLEDQLYEKEHDDGIPAVRADRDRVRDRGQAIGGEG